MHATSNTHAETALPEPTPGREAVVQDRPTLGSLPRARRKPERWLVPSIDFVSSSLVLTIVALLDGAAVFPALPIAPLVLLGLYGILGVYGAQPSSQALGEEDGPAWPVIRILMAAGFVWSASLITDLSITAQLALWLGFVLLDTIGRGIGGRHIRKLDVIERWVLVGEPTTTERLKAYKPLRARATIVCTVTPDEDD